MTECVRIKARSKKMTYQDFLNEIAENDKKIAAEHFTEEQEEAAYTDFIIKNKCKIKKANNGK